jgi:hypothetical protein
MGFVPQPILRRSNAVIPAKAGIHLLLQTAEIKLDSGAAAGRICRVKLPLGAGRSLRRVLDIAQGVTGCISSGYNASAGGHRTGRAAQA